MALTDSAFREQLLNGHRREMLDTLSLIETERQVVLAVKANTLDTFAGALYQPAFIGA